ncbi:hypothetical protein LDK02_01675 [Fusobacterium animalis]
MKVKTIDKVTKDYIEITTNNGEKLKLNKIKANEAIYHNIERKNGKWYFNFSEETRYKKYVDEDGHELILEQNNKLVYDPVKEYGKGNHTYSDIIGDLIVFEKMVQYIILMTIIRHLKELNRSIFMLQNRLIITKKSKRNEIYGKSKKKWVIDFGDKIKSWSDFYDIIQKEIDFLNYNKEYGKGNHTYSDIVGDLIVFEKMKEREKEGMVFILDYTENFRKIKDCDEKNYDKSTIYYDLVYNLLVEWYRDNKIIYKGRNAAIDIEVYILIDDNSIQNKVINFDNELIIAIENDRDIVKKQYQSYKEIEIFYPTNEEIKEKKNIGDIQREIFSNLLEKKIALNNLEKLKVIISNSMKIFHELSIYLLVYIIDKILIEKFTEGKEIKMFMIFSNELAE